MNELTGDADCERVIECVGQQWPLDLAAELCSTRGKLIIAGYHHDGLRQVNVQLWNWTGLDVINAHERDVAVYVRGIEDAVGQIFSLDELNQAFETLQSRPEGFVKALVRYA